MAIKFPLFFLFVVFSINVGFAQTQDENHPIVEEEVTDSNRVYEEFEVTELGGFKGGSQALMNFMLRNIEYPQLAQEKKIEGKVLVVFIIEKDGSITQINTEGEKLGYGLEESAVQLVKDSEGQWNPGSINGSPVRVRYQMPIRFKLY